MLQNISQNISLLTKEGVNKNNSINENYEFNIISISSFFQFEEHFLDKCIDEIFENNNSIHIETDTIYRSEEKRILDFIIDGKIVIRNKKFIELLDLLKTVRYHEDGRMNFIKKIQNMDVEQIIENIRQEYDKIYKVSNKKSYEINLSEVGLPHMNVYSYLMTFKRQHCYLSVESSELYLYYNYKKVYYKIFLTINEPKEYYGLSVSLLHHKILLPLEDSYKNNDIFIKYCNCIKQIEYMVNSIFRVKNNNQKKVIINIECMYFEDIFMYHGVDIFDKLNSTYINYSFDIFYHFSKKEEGEEKKKNDYLILKIY
jgi:hypothetical protein